jgi:cobalt-zinc-cadmium efflux system membrane fusion protein
MRYLVALFPLLLCACQAEKSAKAKEENTSVGSRPNFTDPESGGKQLALTPEAQRAMGIVTEQVQRRTTAEVVSATGQLVVNEDQTWHVGALSGGKIDEVLANVGDAVGQGQVLARLHSHDVHEVRAAYQESKAELDRARTAEAYARRVRDRARRLFALKASSQQEVEGAEADLRTAETAVIKAQSEVEKERVHLTEFLGLPTEESGHGSGKPVHGHSEDDVPVAAPASGIVLQRKVTLGTVVSPGDEMFTITNPSSLWMIAAVNEADLSRVRIGQIVRVVTKAYPGRPFSGRVLRRGEALDPVTRTLQVRVLVPNKHGLLKPGMYATAEIEQPSSRQALYVPEAAALEVNGQLVVFVRTSPTRFVPRPIQAARTLKGEMEIANGLRVGEQVVVKGGFVLKSHLFKSSLQEQ